MSDDVATPVVGSARVVDAAATRGDRAYAMFIHLMLVIASFTGLTIIVGPLVMWLVRRGESRFIDDHGREALNFNLSVLLYYAALLVAGFVTCGVGWYLMSVVWVFSLVVSIRAAVAAHRGEYYRYPACVRLV